MSWKMLKEKGKVIWECSLYSDLQYNEINNFAQYGQPSSPYQTGFVHDDAYIPDFSNIIIRMPQREVMNKGYGRLIEPIHFPVIKSFLRGDYKLPNGRYTFDDIVIQRYAQRGSKMIFTNLYGTGSYPVASGVAISSGDAAYIHGSVGFSLMRSTQFDVSDDTYRVIAVVGALDDNWNFKSGNGLIQKLNPLVETLFGPDHNNLEPTPEQIKKGQIGDISIEYRGEGKKMFAGGL